MNKPECKTCIFWDVTDEKFSVARGSCRFNAPIGVVVESTSPEAHTTPRALWPVTFDYEWCGEWKDGKLGD